MKSLTQEERQNLYSKDKRIKYHEEINSKEKINEKEPKKNEKKISSQFN